MNTGNFVASGTLIKLPLNLQIYGTESLFNKLLFSLFSNDKLHRKVLYFAFPPFFTGLKPQRVKLLGFIKCL